MDRRNRASDDDEPGDLEGTPAQTDPDTDEATESDREPEAFYVWKNEGGAHLPSD